MAKHLALVTVSHQAAHGGLYGRTNILSLWGVKPRSRVARARLDSGLSISSPPQEAQIQVRIFECRSMPNSR